MKRFTTFLSLLFLTSSLFAQIPDGYYSTTTGKAGAELKTELYTIIKGHTVLSYSDLWNAFKTTDVKPNGKVWDMYSDNPNGTPPYEYTFGIDQCGNYSGENQCYNREHSFPQSWFDKSSPMVSDMFHIYPTDGYVNAMRSNYPFGEVGTPSRTSQNGSKLGPSNYPGYSGTVFEPLDEYKGDFARTYFYMATRYENLIASWKNNGSLGEIVDGTSFPVYKQWVINMFIDWHNADPVSPKEIERNNDIFANYQHNRNPFIDHPEFVNQIWGTPVFETVDVPSIAALRQKPADGMTAIYKITGVVFLTFQDAQTNKKYIQDPNGAAAIEMDVSNGIITTSYNLLDGISNLTGTLQTVNGMLTFIPVLNPDAATSSNNIVIPAEKTMGELTSADQAKLIKISNATFNSTGTFANGSNYPISDASGNLIFRTQFADVNYIGTAIPTTQSHITGIVLEKNGTIEIAARNSADIEVASTNQTYKVTLETNPASAVSELIGNGNYSAADNVSISAGAATGYKFTNWTGEADVVSSLESATASSTSFKMPAKDVTLTANYEVYIPKQYTLNISIIGGGSVTANGATYSEPLAINENETVELVAIAQSGWKFSGWSGDITSISEEESVPMTANKSITATFVKYTGPVTIVEWYFEDSNVTADGGIADNLGSEISTNATDGISYTGGSLPNELAATGIGWHSGMSTKYWMIDFSTLGYRSISLSSKQKSSNTGPRDFKVQYKLETGDWMDVSGANVTAANDFFINGILSDISLPAATSNVNKVYLRWVMSSNTAVNGNEVASAGTSRIDDIVITGVVASVGIESSELKSIKLFPNPVENILHIERESSEPIILEIYSNLGVIHSTQVWNSNSFNLDVSDYKTGIYIVRFAGNNTKYLKFLKK